MSLTVNAAYQYKSPLSQEQVRDDLQHCYGTLGWLSKKLLHWYATLTFKSQSTTTTMSSLINLLTSKETSLEAETFLMDRSHVCARFRGKYGRNDCKMYMAVSRNSIKVARNPWHKIPLWTQVPSMKICTQFARVLENSISFPSFCMCQDMRLEICWLSKPLVTGIKRTDIRSVTSVDTNMST